jgi:hypothetical protein
MRYLTFCLLLMGASSLGAMEAWRWVDKDGVVHFSDQPMPGAEKFQLNAAPKPGSVAPPASPRSSSSQAGLNAEDAFHYNRCGVLGPSQDEMFQGSDTVKAALELLPNLRSGDRVEVTLNGQIVLDWPQSITSYQFNALPRGSYQLSGRVLAPDGRTLCTLPVVTFHVRQPSLLTPGRAAAPRS